MKKSEISQYFSKLGKKGGPAMLEKYGRDFMSEIGKMGAKKRWENKKKKDLVNKEENGEEAEVIS